MLLMSGLFICRWFGLTEVNLCPWLESLTPWAGLVLHATRRCFHCLHPIIISSLILFVCVRWLQMSGKWWRRRSEALKDLKSKLSFDQNNQADDGLDPSTWWCHTCEIVILFNFFALIVDAASGTGSVTASLTSCGHFSTLCLDFNH